MGDGPCHGLAGKIPTTAMILSHAGFHRSLVALALTSTGVLSVTRSAAQTVDFYGVDKRVTYLQNSASAPVTPATNLADPNGPYHFSATVSGSNLDLLSPAPTVTLTNATVLNLVD